MGCCTKAMKTSRYLLLARNCSSSILSTAQKTACKPLNRKKKEGEDLGIIEWAYFLLTNSYGGTTSTTPLSVTFYKTKVYVFDPVLVVLVVLGKSKGEDSRGEPKGLRKRH